MRKEGSIVSNQRMHTGRIIFHIDMNCFYAAVEMAIDPSLKGRPVAIAGNPKERKGIIVTSSYEARAKGVRTTMPLWEAKKLCPELHVLPPNFEQYRNASKEMFKILASITPHIEPISIDEGYVDVTDVESSLTAVQLAEHIQQRILTELDLPCSIGIGPNKFLAKMASDMKKPLGITVLRIRDVSQVLWPESIDKMYGVGKRTAEKLHSIEIRTIKDLANADVYSLTHLLGINGERLKDRANGIDPRPVDPDSVGVFKSIGSSRTFPDDTDNIAEIEKMMNELATQIEIRMERRKIAGMSVQVMIRYANRRTITRSKKLPTYVWKQSDIVQIARQLFFDHWNEEPIRLLGITVQEIDDLHAIGHQLDLFTYEKEIEQEKLSNVIQSLNKKYGKHMISTVELEEKRSPFKTSFQKDFLDDYKQGDRS